MGSGQSSDRIKEIPYEKKLPKLERKFNEDRLAKVRDSSSVRKDVNAFCRIGVYLNDKKPTMISKENLDKVCFMTINTYNRKTYKLGSGPINDGYMIAMNHYRRGYQIYFLHNPSRLQFMSFTSFFLRNTKTALTIFYEGRSTTLVGNGDEVIKGKSEAIVFDLNYLKDHEMGELLSRNAKTECKVVLLSNCCGGPAIWCLDSNNFQNIELPPNIISICVKNKEDSLKNHSNQKIHHRKKRDKTAGLFIYYLLRNYLSFATSMNH